MLFLCCRISRLQLLEFQYYSMVDKMAVLEALTMQQLLVSMPVPFHFHLTVVSFLHLSHFHSIPAPSLRSSQQWCPITLHHTHTHYTARTHMHTNTYCQHTHTYIPYTTRTHAHTQTQAFVTRLKKQLFVEALVQGNMTSQVSPLLGGVVYEYMCLICSSLLFQEAKGLMTYICT